MSRAAIRLKLRGLSVRYPNRVVESHVAQSPGTEFQPRWKRDALTATRILGKWSATDNPPVVLPATSACTGRAGFGSGRATENLACVVPFSLSDRRFCS